jgi:GT2 family glycosyltransferase
VSKIDYFNYEIVLVDNGSTDDSVAVARQMFPDVRVIELPENRGFVGGNNEGIQAALNLNPDYVLLLNNDTETDPKFLTSLVQAAEADPTIGIAGPVIYYFDDAARIWSAGGMIEWAQGDTKMLMIHQIDPHMDEKKSYPVDFVTGCCLLIRREVISKIGLLDPRFFMYYEETEWCVRAKAAGYQIICVPQAKIWHKISTVEREDSPQVKYYMTRNRLLFLRLSKASWPAWIHTILYDYARTYLSWSLKPKWRNKKSVRKALVQALWDFSRGRFGKVDFS